jgi:putative photosynthetic complex assembly protein
MTRPASSVPNAKPKPSARHDHDMNVPTPVLIATGCLLALTILFAVVARHTDIGATRLEPAPALESRMISAVLDGDGNTVLRDAGNGQIVETLPAASDGFIKIVLRMIDQQRKLEAATADSPLRLSRLTNGQLTLTDPATGRVLVLTAFGPANADAFGRLLSR